MYSFKRNGFMNIRCFRQQKPDEVVRQYASYGLGKFAVV